MGDTTSPSPPSPKKSRAAATGPPSKKAPVQHPKYIDMIKAAILALKERNGSSRQAILKYIQANYKVSPDNAHVHLKGALKRGVANETLKQVKGTGASGSFKLTEKAKAKKPQEKKPVKKTTAKKPTAKKTATKKSTTKKTTTTPKKRTTTKKTSAKKPAGSAATKKGKKATPGKKSSTKKNTKKPAKKTPVKKKPTKKSGKK